MRNEAGPGGQENQCSDNLECFLGVDLSLVTVGDLVGPGTGDLSLVVVEYLLAELELIILQLVDVVLELGKFRVESLLLRSEFDLKRRMVGIVDAVSPERDKKCPRLIINSVARQSSGQSESD